MVQRYDPTSTEQLPGFNCDGVIVGIIEELTALTGAFVDVCADVVVGVIRVAGVGEAGPDEGVGAAL